MNEILQPQTDGPVITARGVTVRIGDVAIVDDVSIEVERGGWLGLLGPNGAGKTTLLRALAGLVHIDGGTISIDGLDVATAKPRTLARRVALVDQRPVLPAGMLVRDYVLLGRTAHIGALRMETARDLAVVEEAIERLEVGRFVDRDVLTLSGGEAQRVVLARALAQEAPVLLLDEPTSALDLAHEHTVLELVDELRRERNITVISSLHDLTIAGQFAVDAALLACGQLIAAGPIAEVLSPSLIERTYGAEVRVFVDEHGHRIVVPTRTHHRGPPSTTGSTAPASKTHSPSGLTRLHNEGRS